MSIKVVIIWLLKQKKPIREMAKTLGVCKPTVIPLLTKKKYTSKVRNIKNTQKTRETTKTDDCRILYLLKKKPLDRSAIMWRRWISRDAFINVNADDHNNKPLVTFKKRKARLECIKTEQVYVTHYKSN